MRNEAKSKQTARLGNFKNIALSVAHRHPRLLCYELSSSRLCDSPPECGPCNQLCSLESEPEHIRVSFTQLIPNMDSKTIIAQPTWVKQFGLTLNKDAYIIICSDGFYSIFGKVHTIFY